MSKPQSKRMAAIDAYPNAELFWMHQGSEKWHTLRDQLLTSSNFGAWLLKTGKVADGARQKAMGRIISNAFDCAEREPFESWAMERGKALEVVARKYFVQETGLDVQEVGFCKSREGLFGCSPDGLIPAKRSGLEIKCPLPETHVCFLLDGALPDTHRIQVKGSMAVTGADSWHFYSFVPNLPVLHLIVERDDEVEELRSALVEFSFQLEERMNGVRKMWDEKPGCTQKEAIDLGLPDWIVGRGEYGSVNMEGVANE